MYRENVGAVLFNRSGLVFVGERAGVPGAWQFPQGGIDAGETPRQAVLRELEEEIGTAQAEILAEHEDWLTYDLPPEVAARVWGGKFRGQRQRWFALRFLGEDSDIRLDRHQREFATWRWERLDAIPALAVDFKRPIYETLVKSFAPFASSPPVR